MFFPKRLLPLLLLTACFRDYLPQWRQQEGYGNAGKVVVYRSGEWHASRPVQTGDNTFTFNVRRSDKPGDLFYGTTVYIAYTAPHFREHEYYLLQCAEPAPLPEQTSPSEAADPEIEPEPEPCIDPEQRVHAERMMAEINKSGSDRSAPPMTKGGAATILGSITTREPITCTVTSFGAAPSY